MDGPLALSQGQRGPKGRQWLGPAVRPGIGLRKNERRRRGTSPMFLIECRAFGARSRIPA